MYGIYPKDVFKKYLIKNLEIPEQYFYISERIAGGVAYDSFMRHVFGLENDFYDAALNIRTGHFYYDINSHLYDKGSPFTPRLTPNFITLFSPQILNNHFLTTLIAMGNELLKEENEIYIIHTSILLEFTNKGLENYEAIKKNVENYKVFLNNFSQKKMLKKFKEMKNNNFGLDKFSLIEKPWF